MVNAWGGGVSDLWCAPGGGVEKHASLEDNLKREVLEETGLDITVGALAMVNEFHAPKDGFHQVDIYFHARIVKGSLTDTWRDPEGIVTQRRFFSREELATIRYKPNTLPQAAWEGQVIYDPLELLIK